MIWYKCFFSAENKLRNWHTILWEEVTAALHWGFKLVVVSVVVPVLLPVSAPLLSRIYATTLCCTDLSADGLWGNSLITHNTKAHGTEDPAQIQPKKNNRTSNIWNSFFKVQYKMQSSIIIMLLIGLWGQFVSSSWKV